MAAPRVAHRSVEIKEKPIDLKWKSINRALQVIGVIFTGISIAVLIIIQREVNEINTKTKQVDRSLQLANQLLNNQESALAIEQLFFRTESLVSEYSNLSKEDIVPLVHLYVHSELKKNDELRTALFSQLELLKSINLCLTFHEPDEASICDQGTILSALGDKIISYYIYLRPIVHCDSFFSGGKYSNSVISLAEQFALWSPKFFLDEKEPYEEGDEGTLISIGGEYDCDVEKKKESVKEILEKSDNGQRRDELILTIFQND